ncbi:hypothetical protein [Flavobacterium ammonificans]|nr:hypothetical protein [Flavobacterium ammonificans]
MNVEQKTKNVYLRLLHCVRNDKQLTTDNQQPTTINQEQTTDNRQQPFTP